MHRPRLLRAPRPRRAAPREPDAVVAAEDGVRLAAWVSEPTAAPPRSRADRLLRRRPEPATVVLVHGWTLAAVAWERTVAELARVRPDVRVVRYDQRGHGASRTASTAAGPASIRLLGADLAAVVRALAPTGPLVLGGHSMGGMAVLSGVGHHPELLGPRTRGVLLCSTSAGGLSASGRPLVPLMAALARLPEAVNVPRAPRLLTQRTNYGPGVDPALVAATSRAMGPVSGRSTGEWFAALMAHDERAALPALAASGAGVQVLVGDADRLTPVDHAQALAAALPQARLRVVPGAGHMLFVERPDVVVRALVELLAP